MDWLEYEQWRTILTLIPLLFLIGSYYFYLKSNYDERRKRRFRLKRFVTVNHSLRNKFENKQFDETFRRFGLPSYINSVNFNMVRFGSMSVLIAVNILQIYLDTEILSFFSTMALGTMTVFAVPKRGYPLYTVLTLLKKRYSSRRNHEVYQLYNEIKAEFKSRGKNVRNTHFLIREVLPYYTYIRPSLEKILPYLESNQHEKAWEIFENEIETEEAKSLGILMKDIEATGYKEALGLIEEARQEFSNAIINDYKAYLSRRKFFYFALTSVGVFVIFLNEVNIFFIWYKNVMEVVNKLG